MTMNVLTAAVGTEPDDFAYTLAGEVVYLGVVCERGEEGRCVCGRSFTGMTSGEPTTVAVVGDLDVTRGQLVAMFAPFADGELAGDFADEVLEVAAGYPLGTRLRRRAVDDDVVPE